MTLEFNDDHESLLIWLYLEISDFLRQSELDLDPLRLSNNNVPLFTDAELFTCGIFAELMGCKHKKHGYQYIKRHFHSWFPQLPCYEVSSRKLNHYFEALLYIYNRLSRKYGKVSPSYAIIDTAPIEVCQAQHAHHSKAAQPFVSKGYCAAKDEYYIGAKLQVVAQARTHQLPFPFEFSLASASFHDLTIAKATLPDSEFYDIDLYSTNAYIDNEFQIELVETKEIKLITPIKKKKGQHQLTLFQQASNSIHSSLRQPIDALFAWINEKTGIQNASKVRSENGLFYHVCVKMIAALILLVIQF